jgi:hypothetical protein
MDSDRCAREVGRTLEWVVALSPLPYALSTMKAIQVGLRYLIKSNIESLVWYFGKRPRLEALPLPLHVVVVGVCLSLPPGFLTALHVQTQCLFASLHRFSVTELYRTTYKRKIWGNLPAAERVDPRLNSTPAAKCATDIY